MYPHRLAKAVSCASSSLVPSPSLLPVAGPPVCSRCGSVDRTASVPQLLISRLDPREVIIDTLLDMLRRRTGDRGIRMICLGLAEVRAPNGAHVAGEGGVEAQQHEGVVCDRQGRRDRLVGIEIRSHVGLIGVDAGRGPLGVILRGCPVAPSSCPVARSSCIDVVAGGHVRPVVIGSTR